MSAPAPTMNPRNTMVGTSNGVGLWVGPDRANRPTDINADFASPWAPVGYVSDDGVTIGGDTTTESFTPWQSRVPIRTVITEKSRTIGFTMWELTALAMSIFFDQDISVNGDGDFEFEVRSDAAQIIRAVAVDVRDGDNSLRLIYPRATVESTGDMTLTKGAMVPLEVTLNALDDNGTLLYVQRHTAEGPQTLAVPAGNGNGEAQREQAPAQAAA